MKDSRNPPSRLRRRIILAPSAALLPGLLGGVAAFAQGPPPAPSGDRIALLIGNRDYPGNQDLPPMHTNVRQLKSALEALGFQATSLLDGDRAGSLRAVEAFGRQLQALPANGTALFYFCGHGMQIDAENFLLPSGIFPRFRSLDDSLKLYIALRRNVLEPLPPRPNGQIITVIDACRTSPKKLENVADDGFNQVRPLEGELIVFSTSAGKPALAPIDETRRTFFTDSLIRQLERQARTPEELSFRELFRLVSSDVQRTMRAHPLEDIRALTQVPYIADFTRRAVRVSLRDPTPPEPPKPPPVVVQPAAPGASASAQPALPPPPPPPPPEDPRIEQAAFGALGETLWPGDVLKLSRAFAERYPNSRFFSAAQVAADGAADAAKLLSRPDISLYRRDFQLEPTLGESFNEDLRRAARGDKDASARVAERLLPAESSGRAAQRYEGWMQYAAELGNGIASYDLARYYNERGQPAKAATWASRATQLGYVVPPQLRITR